MPYIATTILALVTTVATFVGFYNYVPQDYFSFQSERLGNTSITTILGTDTISGSRTTINNNFSSLNTNKLEISDLIGTTTLPSMTISGTLTLSNALLVTSGGTGSTTLSSNQILLGNGTGGVKVVNGYGTSGQFLTSNGAATAPTWQTSALDLAGTYAWTGLHSFSATTTMATTTFGTFSLAPIIAGTAATNTVPMVTQNKGNILSLQFKGVCRLLDYATVTPRTLTGDTNENLVFGTYVPADALGSNGVLIFKQYITPFTFSATANATFRAYYGSAQYYGNTFNVSNGIGTGIGTIETKIYATTSETAQQGNFFAQLTQPVQDSEGTVATRNTIVFATSTVNSYMTTDSRTQQQFRVTYQHGNSTNSLSFNGGELMVCR